MDKKKIGLYSGTFDPIHQGHISFAQTAMSTLKLEHVIVLPERQPRTKMAVSGFDERFSLAQTALANHPGLSVRALHATQHTTEAVMSELHELFASAKVTLLVGSDVAKGMHAWVGVARLLKDHSLCIGLRGEETEQSVSSYVQNIEKLYGFKVDVSYVATEFRHVSSTAIRQETSRL